MYSEEIKKHIKRLIRIFSFRNTLNFDKWIKITGIHLVASSAFLVPKGRRIDKVVILFYNLCGLLDGVLIIFDIFKIIGIRR